MAACRFCSFNCLQPKEFQTEILALIPIQFWLRDGWGKSSRNKDRARKKSQEDLDLNSDHGTLFKGTTLVHEVYKA